MNKFLVFLGKLLSKISKAFNLGGGSTWPGHIALKLNKNFISDILKNSKTKIILVAGTNGKTTTSKLTKAILEEDNKSVLLNDSGANLLNGLASSLISNSNSLGRLNKDFAIFEVDENTVPLILSKITPDYIIALNLFRDQLDRYGEVNTIAKHWKESFVKLPSSTTLILNGDDPLISYLGENISAKTLFFGINDIKYAIKSKQNAADSIYCPFCGERLTYEEIYFSHLGNWECTGCKRKRNSLNIENYSNFPLPGTYNIYNTLASVLLAKTEGINENTITSSLSKFRPAFGRQEKLDVQGKNVQIFLSKNPTSFNESLRTIKELGGKDILIVLNDRIPDGRDVSWIWDTDIENLLKGDETITVSGDRTYDMALRIKYGTGNKNFVTIPNLKLAIEKAMNGKNKNLYILPTYSAMLEVRKILTGRKIL